MTNDELARYLARIQDAETPAQLVEIQKELSRVSHSHERATLQQTITRMILRRAAET